MPASSSDGADKEALATFDRYPDLPGELRIKIIRGFIANWRDANPSSGYRAHNFAMFAGLHSEWQQELEPQPELWGSLSLTADDLVTFRLMLSKLRRDSLSEVILWISIKDNVISPDGQAQHLINSSDIKSRVSEFIVHSVSTLLECVDHCSSTCPRPVRKGIECYTKITYPKIMGLGSHTFDCDFSRIPITNAVCTFSQGKHFRGPRPIGSSFSLIQNREDFLNLSPSSLLSLFSRLPNLERASLCLDTPDLTAPVATSEARDFAQVSDCPRIKVLSLIRVYSLHGQNQDSHLENSLPWVSNWSQSIERLTLVDRDIAGFLRGLSTLGHSTGTITWPNLQMIYAGGCYEQEGFPRRGNNFEDVLSAVAATLVVLPAIGDIVVTQHCVDILCPSIMTELSLRSESSQLDVTYGMADPMPMKQSEQIRGAWRGVSNREPRYFWKLFSQHGATKLAAAVADIQAIVSKQHGQDLKVTLPERDEEPESP
ncbi:hypothetical protein KVR01_009275 [Diaporthe batatas]|uniref:uncharacterized protein n=1 Tax=Diaporthe batatas TaxID=748121 RepID=UPI001D0495B9|nr:uncharacterized protein KVR01_009275 [Diaporthe batatas]KAG8161011.1 hypothetical protein KVR01_009275 [Diaporthe batatas]